LRLKINNHDLFLLCFFSSARRALTNPSEAEEEEEEVEIPPLNLVREGPDKSTTGGTPRFEDGSDNLRVARTKTLETYQQRVPCPAATGSWIDTQEHTLVLSSAYRLYTQAVPNEAREVDFNHKTSPTDIFPCANEEPSYTCHSESHKVTVDYIFFQHERLIPAQILSSPSKKACLHIDPREPAEVPDPNRPKPDDWDDRAQVMLPNYDTGEMELGDNPEYQGKYVPPAVSNPNQWHCYLPNDRFSSDHTAIMASFVFNESHLSSTCSSEANPPPN